MSKEIDKDIIAKLKEAFPEGLPDSSSLFFATEANPIKSYQELRRALGVTTAVGNRKCYKALMALLDVEDPVEPEPTKVTLKIIGNDTVVEGEEYSFDVRAEGGAANNTVVKVNGVVNNKYKVVAELPTITIEATASNADKVTKVVTVEAKPLPEETE
ncbi:hypothetical protein vBPMCPL1_0017 [Proteus phage vB_PMC-PL1]